MAQVRVEAYIPGGKVDGVVVTFRRQNQVRQLKDTWPMELLNL
jgi:hypothetical protein